MFSKIAEEMELDMEEGSPDICKILCRVNDGNLGECKRTEKEWV
jgi:hypothetical protein